MLCEGQRLIVHVVSCVGNLTTAKRCRRCLAALSPSSLALLPRYLAFPNSVGLAHQHRYMSCILVVTAGLALLPCSLMSLADGHVLFCLQGPDASSVMSVCQWFCQAICDQYAQICPGQASLL